MSRRSVEHWIRELPDLTQQQRLLMYTLATYRNRKTAQCNPSASTLAEDIGTSERTVRRWLKQLEERGVVGLTLGRFTYQIDFRLEPSHSDTQMSDCHSDKSGQSLGQIGQVTRTNQASHSDMAVSDKPCEPTEPCEPKGGHLRKGLSKVTRVPRLR